MKNFAVPSEPEIAATEEEINLIKTFVHQVIEKAAANNYSPGVFLSGHHRALFEVLENYESNLTRIKTKKEVKINESNRQRKISANETGA